MLALVLALAVSALAAQAPALAPVVYLVSFPEPQHRYAQIEVVFADVGAAPLEIRMSRSSPGRYALHEFARNVFDVHAVDGRGRMLSLDRPAPHRWTVSGHGGTVRVRYKVYGDQVDGTSLAIDTTHAHMNMPATLVWARGMEDRPARITFERPAGTDWKVATQLRPTGDPLTFTAANLQYLMDSPVEFSDFTWRTATVSLPEGRAVSPARREATIRLALHHDGSERDADALVDDIVRIVREAGVVFGEFPGYDVGHFTFLADYLPYASGDGMEHRNSSVLTSSGALRNPGQRASLLGTVAHEFFHGWNVERIRPRSLEPFDFEEANMSGELWLAEGVTSYYETLLMRRAGLATLEQTAAELGRTIDTVTRSPGRQFHSAVEMSRLAPFVDAARWVDRTNWENLYISYYTWGAALGLALDLSLRDLTGGRASLDDYMRLMWQRYGRPSSPVEGLVAVPYTLRDARDRLADVSGDRAFADAFFDRFVEGREVADYAGLLDRAGLLLRRGSPGRAWLGDVRFAAGRRGARLGGPAPFGSPIHRAGLDQDDEIVSLEGVSTPSAREVDGVLRRLRPGDTVPIVFERRGERVSGRLTLAEDPTLEVVPAERAGRLPSDAQRAFRDDWLSTKP
ncbi:MAG: M61 family metallopeptidase [Gemmatimonadetes bacterium]|nr:M61 family metallopeptidase [Gemmatimonadota bacterium]